MKIMEHRQFYLQILFLHLNKNRLSEQLYNIKRGTWMECLMLSFVYLTFISRTIENLRFLFLKHVFFFFIDIT